MQCCLLESNLLDSDINNLKQQLNPKHYLKKDADTCVFFKKKKNVYWIECPLSLLRIKISLDEDTDKRT